MQPTPKRGDVLIFTEAALHGTLPWTSDRERRTVIYRFAPSNVAYGRGYVQSQNFTEGSELIHAWPENMTIGMSEAQLAVMLPPFNSRLNRPTLNAQGEVVQAQPRAEFKIEFDEKVFGSKYY